MMWNRQKTINMQPKSKEGYQTIYSMPVDYSPIPPDDWLNEDFRPEPNLGGIYDGGQSTTLSSSVTITHSSSVTMAR
jgi:hypothetical protein